MSEILTLSDEMIKRDARTLIAEHQKILSTLDDSFVGDSKIRHSISKQSAQISELLELLEYGPRKQEFTAHPLGSIAIHGADGWDDASFSPAVRKWRRDLDNVSYETIPPQDRKEVFDYYFARDVHGHLDDPNTVHLSRGVNDPEFFTPPAIVTVSINASSDNNWFGYSDSLGHADTREAIADLEKLRRTQSNFKPENTAVVMGGTAGLNAVLSMISRKNGKSGCAVIAPNYAPIIDDVEHHFKPNIVDLDEDYALDKDALLRVAKDEDTSVVLLSVPHNPSGGRDYLDILPELHEACSSHGGYLIVDEIIYDDKASPFFDPVRFPNLIVISSYSKSYNIPGLKLGHLLADKNFVSEFYRHASTTYGSPPSFLYLTATAIALFEKAEREQGKPKLPQSIADQVSDGDLLWEEFKLWKKHLEINKRVQKHFVSKILKEQRNCSIEEVLGLDDPSPNCVLRMKGEGSAYSISMSVIAAANISVMPVDCFSPPKSWPRDLRASISVNPQELLTAFPELITQLDDIIAAERAELWSGIEAKNMKFQSSAEKIGCGRLLRRTEALQDIYNIVAGVEPVEAVNEQLYAFNKALPKQSSLEEIRSFFKQAALEGQDVGIESQSFIDAEHQERITYLMFLSDSLSDIRIPKVDVDSLHDVFDLVKDKTGIEPPTALFIDHLNTFIKRTSERSLENV